MRVIDWLTAWCDRRGRKRVVYDHRDPTAEYMIRRYLAGDCTRDGVDGALRHNRWAICLHRILRSDMDDLHDHPGCYMSLILEGSYIEHTPKGSFIRKPGNVRFRSARSRHRLELPWGPVTTLFLFGPRSREWGFYPRGQYVRWDKHLAETLANNRIML